MLHKRLIRNVKKSSYEADSCLIYQEKKLPTFMQPDESLRCAQILVTEPYPKPSESSRVTPDSMGQ